MAPAPAAVNRDDDPVEPRPEATVISQRRQLVRGADERFLEQIVTVGIAAGGPPRHERLETHSDESTRRRGTKDICRWFSTDRLTRPVEGGDEDWRNFRHLAVTSTCSERAFRNE
jgi:hypothetical protein